MAKQCAAVKSKQKCRLKRAFQYFRSACFKQLTRHCVALLVLISVGISAHAQSGRKVVRIGWAGPLTGNSAVLGIDSARAMAMVFEQANSDSTSKIEFKLVSEDDAYSTQKAVSAYRKLVGVDKVPAIIFLTYGGLFAVAARAEQDNVLLIDPLDCNESVAKLPKNTVCVAAMTEGIGRLNAETALKRGYKKAALLFSEEDPFMATVVKSTTDILKAGGTEIAFSQGYSGTQSDFRTLLLRAKSSQVDSLYFYGYDEAATGMKQARQLGLKAQFFATAVVMSPPFLSAVGSSIEGTIFSVFNPANQALYSRFISEFTKRYGTPPILDIATVPSYDVANIIVNFARNYTGAVDSPDFFVALREHIYALRNYQGASGQIDMEADGATRSLRLGIYQVRNGLKVNL